MLATGVATGWVWWRDKWHPASEAAVRSWTIRVACGGEAAASTEGAGPGGGTGCSQRQLGVSTAPCQCRGGKSDGTFMHLDLKLCVCSAQGKWKTDTHQLCSLHGYGTCPLPASHSYVVFKYTCVYFNRMRSMTPVQNMKICQCIKS